MRPGLYDQLLTLTLEEELSRLGDPQLYELAPVDCEDSHAAISQFLEHVLVHCLATYRGKGATDGQTRLVDRIILTLEEELGHDWAQQLRISTPLRRLIAIHGSPPTRPIDRPDTPLARSALLTGSRLDPSLGSQLRKELATADRVDILCSFIKWSGLRILLDELRHLAARPSADGPRIRVLTTSYMGATDPRAVEELSSLPNTDIRISYDTKRTRLHAKAYMFHRETGFGSAYVGSANLSNAALTEGLEWTTKLSQYELPYLWTKLTGTFDTHWRDDEFQTYHGDSPEQLRRAIASERTTLTEKGTSVVFDLRPFPFQSEILDLLAAERTIQDKYRHLVVAATGTGKTMISAFDYTRFCNDSGNRLTLLYVAHREEILQQALGSFRGVLRDQNFGDLLVGGREPTQYRHLFCSIQSYNSRKLWQRPSDEFEYIVIDECHHATAQSYGRLLTHVQPRVLLGLTATPERADQGNVLELFGGRFSAEVRLPDAINRRLLCPFQYFGVADSVDLDGLAWQRGGYRIEDLERLYAGNDVRAQLILDKTHELLLDPFNCRGLAFCVSVAHAEFMAGFFNDHGLPALALTAESPAEVRRAARDQLRSRSINFIFVVDLYNEGVDIPEVDTLLFLRPTRSLTIFLQQLGRGLRLHEDKDCLTVLDFIGAQRREFQFARRFRALSTMPAGRLDREIERGFPHLACGCVIQLERIAQERVLANVRETVRLQRPRMVNSIRALGRSLDRPPKLGEAIVHLDTSMDEILKRGLWSCLLADAGLIESPQDPDQERLAKGLRRLCHVDSADQLRQWLKLLDGGRATFASNCQRLETMLHVTLWGKQSLQWSLEKADHRMRQNTAAITDLGAILSHQLQHAPSHRTGQLPTVSGPLTVHAQYTRDEILVGLGHWSLNRRPLLRTGVLHIASSKVDAFFVTLQKTEEDYSPTTMYEDYLISRDRFHWQSQSTTSTDSPTGNRYIQHQTLGYTPLLFVRDRKKLASGLTAPYFYLGPCEYLSHQGTRPVSIVWKLRHAVPARLFRVMARQHIG